MGYFKKRMLWILLGTTLLLGIMFILDQTSENESEFLIQSNAVVILHTIITIVYMTTKGLPWFGHVIAKVSLIHVICLLFILNLGTPVYGLYGCLLVYIFSLLSALLFTYWRRKKLNLPPLPFWQSEIISYICLLSLVSCLRK
jgi:hypothetical protein